MDIPATLAKSRVAGMICGKNLKIRFIQKLDFCLSQKLFPGNYELGEDSLHPLERGSEVLDVPYHVVDQVFGLLCVFFGQLRSVLPWERWPSDGGTSLCDDFAQVL